jgi:hypothetical protein
MAGASDHGDRAACRVRRHARGVAGDDHRPGDEAPASPTEGFATLGKVGRDETYTLVVYLWSSIPSYIDGVHTHDPARFVRARVRDLTVVVENTFRDSTTGRPSGITVPGVWKHEITSIIPTVGPIENGFGASSTIEITFTARI